MLSESFKLTKFWLMTQLICWFVLVNFEHIQHIFFFNFSITFKFLFAFCNTY